MPCSLLSGAIERISATTAPQPAATMTPVSSRRDCVQLPSPCASPKTTSVVASAPANAAPPVAAAPTPNRMARIAPTPAPPEIPST